MNDGGEEEGEDDEDDEENLDSVSVFSKNSFDKMKNSLSSNTETVIKTCFDERRKDADDQQSTQQQMSTRNKRKAYTTNRESAASSPLQFDEEDEDDDQEQEDAVEEQPAIKKQCTDQRLAADGLAKEAVAMDTGYEKSELFLSDLVGLRERLIDAVNKVIYKTFESFCENKFKSSSSDTVKASATIIPVAAASTLDSVKPLSAMLNPQKQPPPQGLSSSGVVPYGTQNLRTREKPLSKPDENARFGATSLRHQPFKSSLPALPVKKVGDRIRTKQSSGSFHMTKLLESSSNRTLQKPLATTPYNNHHSHHHHHSVRDDIKRRVMPNGGGIKSSASSNFMASKLIAVKNEKPATSSSTMPLVKSEKNTGNSLLSNVLMNDHQLPGGGSRSSSNSLLTPSNPLLKSANGGMSAAASLYAAAMSHLQQSAAAGQNGASESAGRSIGSTSSPRISISTTWPAGPTARRQLAAMAAVVVMETRFPPSRTAS